MVWGSSNTRQLRTTKLIYNFCLSSVLFRSMFVVCYFSHNNVSFAISWRKLFLWKLSSHFCRWQGKTIHFNVCIVYSFEKRIDSTGMRRKINSFPSLPKFWKWKCGEREQQLTRKIDFKPHCNIQCDYQIHMAEWPVYARVSASEIWTPNGSSVFTFTVNWTTSAHRFCVNLEFIIRRQRRWLETDVMWCVFDFPQNDTSKFPRRLRATE